MMRFLIADERLCFLPPRLGALRTDLVQFKTANQANTSLLLETTLLSSSFNCVAQAGRADFGICLIIGTETGVKSATNVLLEIPPSDATETETGSVCVAVKGAAGPVSYTHLTL